MGEHKKDMENGEVGGLQTMTPTLTTFNDIADSIEAYHTNPSAYKGKSTGSHKLDEYATMKEGALWIITGIPSSGKSELLDQIMLNSIALHFRPNRHRVQIRLAGFACFRGEQA